MLQRSRSKSREGTAIRIAVARIHQWRRKRTNGKDRIPALAPLMIPIELISHLARPLSLTLRLFGNMTGGHILLAIIFFLMGLDGLIGWALSGNPLGAVVGGIGGLVMIAFTVGFLYPLKILVSFLQAFIFVMLTMLYISGAIEEAEHHGGEPHPAHH